MKKEMIHPLGENVLVKLVKAEKKTKTGLYLPDSASEDRPQEGVVVAVGESDKIKIKKNQKAIFAKYTGTEIKISGEEYLIIKNDDILAIVK